MFGFASFDPVSGPFVETFHFRFEIVWHPDAIYQA
jgi:hypothetical protein